MLPMNYIGPFVIKIGSRAATVRQSVKEAPQSFNKSLDDMADKVTFSWRKCPTIGKWWGIYPENCRETDRETVGK
jgi:hypothetical protein